MSKLHSAFILALSILPVAPALQEPPEDDFAWDCPATGYLPLRRDLLVSTESLARLLGDPAVTILHVGDESDYARGHLPGALRLPSGEVPALSSSMQRVVLYDAGLGLEAARAYVLLDQLGRADRVALLDGHGAQWIAEGRPFSLDPGGRIPSLEAGATPLDEPDASAVILDARGGEESGAPIAGAVRIPWTENLAGPSSSRLKSESQLRRLYRALPARPDLEVVVVGREACLAYVVAKYLGYSVRLPAGGF